MVEPTTEYRVVASIPTTEGGQGYNELTSDWDSRLDYVLPVAERLEQVDNAVVEIKSREVTHYTVSEAADVE